MKFNYLTITSIEGYSYNIGRLVCMLNSTRLNTIKKLKSIEPEYLNTKYTSDSWSIGSLVMHICSTEVYFRALTFERRYLNSEESFLWEGALKGEIERDDYTSEQLIDSLYDIRKKTLQEFKNVTDDWLEVEVKVEENTIMNNYYCWYHLLEEELSHFGQIKWLIKRIYKK